MQLAMAMLSLGLHGKLGVSVRAEEAEEKMSKFAMKRAVKTKAASTTTITTSPTMISATCFVSASSFCSLLIATALGGSET